MLSSICEAYTVYYMRHNDWKPSNIPYTKNYSKHLMKYWKCISNVQKCPSIYFRSSSTYSMSVDLIYSKKIFRSMHFKISWIKGTRPSPMYTYWFFMYFICLSSLVNLNSIGIFMRKHENAIKLSIWKLQLDKWRSVHQTSSVIIWWQQ